MYRSETGVTGKITVNGKNRSSNSENFRNISAYIHQDDALRPYLTVCEAMTVAAHLKLGFNVTKEYKLKLVSIWLRMCRMQLTDNFASFFSCGHIDSQHIGITWTWTTISHQMWTIIRRSKETNERCTWTHQ